MATNGAPTETHPLLDPRPAETHTHTHAPKFLRLDRVLMLACLVLTVGVLVAAVAGNVAAESTVVNSVRKSFSTLANPVPAPHDPYAACESAPEGCPADPAFTYPRAFAVPAAAVTPVKDQGQRATGWAFGALAVLEGDYRANGVAKGFLKEDEYVAFSEQAYAIGVVEYCTAHRAEPLCLAGGASRNTTEGGVPEWLYYFGAPVQQVLPEGACPYKGAVHDELVCAGRAASLAANPVRFSVRGAESAYSVSGVKRLLLRHQRPLTWSGALFNQTYSVPCAASAAYSATAACRSCEFATEHGCMFLYTTPSYDSDGRYFLSGRSLLAARHALAVVGYNDNFRVDTGTLGQLGRRTLGGFIVKNSRGTRVGHSIKYWTQEISTLEEQLLCPAEGAASSWAPVDTACVQSGGSVADCGSGATTRVRDRWVAGATALVCNERLTRAQAALLGYADCDRTKNYVLASAPQARYLQQGQPSGAWFETPDGSDGYVRVKLFEYDPLSTETKPRLVTTGDTTWLNLARLFVPKTVVGNDPDVCGYFFLPYQYFREASTLLAGRGETQAVTHYDVVWDDSAYLANEDKYPQYDYKFLQASTRRVGTYAFEGPLDYEYAAHAADGTGR